MSVVETTLMTIHICMTTARLLNRDISLKLDTIN
jgi:uncharacterized membrane protein YhdT